MEKRTDLSKLKGRRIDSIRCDQHNTHFEFLSKSGKVLFSVHKDNLFDGDGNYFEDDIT